MYSKIKKTSILIIIPTLILATTFTGSNFIPTYAATSIGELVEPGNYIEKTFTEGQDWSFYPTIDGLYTVELWGPSSGNNGGYIRGVNIRLKPSDTINFYLGPGAIPGQTASQNGNSGGGYYQGSGTSRAIVANGANPSRSYLEINSEIVLIAAGAGASGAGGNGGYNTVGGPGSYLTGGPGGGAAAATITKYARCGQCDRVYTRHIIQGAGGTGGIGGIGGGVVHMKDIHNSINSVSVTDAGNGTVGASGGNGSWTESNHFCASSGVTFYGYNGAAGGYGAGGGSSFVDLSKFVSYEALAGYNEGVSKLKITYIGEYVNEIVSAPQDIAIPVSFNTQKEEVISMLGTTITAITVEGPMDLPVVWTCDTYDPTVPLAHIFEGTLGPLSGNVANSANVKARATINVADVSQGDLYVMVESLVETPTITVIKGRSFNIKCGKYLSIDSGSDREVTIQNNDKTDGYIVITGTFSQSGEFIRTINEKHLIFKVIEEPDSSNVNVTFN
jgi:hypothetical protein